ncbi:hypothetical protein Bca4012_063150 [Brassica carinata]|uniref:Uncharacterized protein n=1 Tax=Brassica carinata TaxID=52824 RepID=A0A8X7SB96_BRACI|nr:hypothetical protein Bca52824_032889 [Brassica carinata]
MCSFRMLSPKYLKCKVRFLLLESTYDYLFDFFVQNLNFEFLDLNFTENGDSGLCLPSISCSNSRSSALISQSIHHNKPWFQTFSSKSLPFPSTFSIVVKSFS